jgi:hypothetical protein
MAISIKVNGKMARPTEKVLLSVLRINQFMMVIGSTMNRLERALRPGIMNNLFTLVILSMERRLVKVYSQRMVLNILVTSLTVNSTEMANTTTLLQRELLKENSQTIISSPERCSWPMAPTMKANTKRI